MNASIIATGSYNQKLMILKISEEGEMLFSRYLASLNSMFGHSILATTQGIVVTGYRINNMKREVFVMEVD